MKFMVINDDNPKNEKKLYETSYSNNYVRLIPKIRYIFLVSKRYPFCRGVC